MRFLLFFLLAPALYAADLQLQTKTAQMKYDTTEFVVAPGEKINLTFENGDDLPHNFVLCQPGTDVVALAMKQMDKPEEAMKRNWLPDDGRIIAHSKMLNPHEKETLTFTMPAKPGVYPFVCTFPGHALTMKGEIRCLPDGPGLQDLRFKLYLGAWKQLPDFATLTPHREGSIPDNLIQFKLDDYKNQFGVVYTATLNVPKNGNYRFYIAGDDGVRVLVDGKQVIEHDGIHPSGSIKEGSTQLDKGPHSFRLEYFQAAGGAEVYAAWKGANFQITPLSTWRPERWKLGAKGVKKAEYPPLPLIVKDEPVIYRNFIAGAGNRGIAVGYPGGINIAWSAESMNLALLWRGAFMDASLHWNSRGGGQQPPLGSDVIHPTGEVSPAPDLKWLGYSLDAGRYPTFRYQSGGAIITDAFRVEGSGTTPQGKLIRTLVVTGAPSPGAKILLATAAKITPADNTFTIAASPTPWTLTVQGAQTTDTTLHLPLQAGTTILTYQWTK